MIGYIVAGQIQRCFGEEPSHVGHAPQLEVLYKVVGYNDHCEGTQHVRVAKDTMLFESPFANLECAWVDRQRFDSRLEADSVVVECIES